MNKQNIAGFIGTPQERSSRRRTAADALPRLEVNVIFTNPPATALALKCAASLAHDLDATIHLRAGIVVPMQLPLDAPPVSIDFTKRQLSRLISQLDGKGCVPAVDIYVCRDWRETLLRVLDPKSPVAIGLARCWWPALENRLVKTLRSKGYRVIVADDKSDAAAARGLSVERIARAITPRMR